MNEKQVKSFFASTLLIWVVECVRTTFHHYYPNFLIYIQRFEHHNTWHDSGVKRTCTKEDKMFSASEPGMHSWCIKCNNTTRNIILFLTTTTHTIYEKKVVIKLYIIYKWWWLLYNVHQCLMMLQILQM